MPISYAGHNSIGVNSASGQANIYSWNNPAVITYTCPNTGSQNLRELSSYVKITSLSTKKIKVAIYSSDGATKIYEVEATVTSSTGAWTGLLSTDAAPGITLTGGSNYILLIAFQDNDTNIFYDDAAANATDFKSFTYPTLPASLPTPDNQFPVEASVRFGVEPLFVPEPSRNDFPVNARNVTEGSYA
jgi:hypothetical protein